MRGRIAEVGIVVPLLVAALLGASCASDPPASTPARTTGPAHVLEPIPATALPGNTADPVDLDAAAIALDAVDAAALRTVLDRAGFVGGTERQFSRVQGGRRRIVARVLAFRTPQGAERYLAWLRGHADEVIGDAAPDPGLRAPGDGSVLVHQPNPCCHNETRIFLAMWSRGSSVVTIQIAGEGARGSDVPELLSQLDAAV
ncbi:MAG TPA: hypothetical protein VFP13_01875 [Actinomycetota bacterium]|nr:hypothetical protein [Actinomycetota bacterium]